MIILREGRTIKKLNVHLEGIDCMSVADGCNVRLSLTHIQVAEIRRLHRESPRKGRPLYYSLFEGNHVYVYPTPDKNYRAHIMGTTLVQL